MSRRAGSRADVLLRCRSIVRVEQEGECIRRDGREVGVVEVVEVPAA